MFSPDHRIRVAISSSNAPRFEPNPNTGEPLLPPELPNDATVHSADTLVAGSSRERLPRVATNTIHLSPAHASSIVLPICSRAE